MAKVTIKVETPGQTVEAYRQHAHAGTALVRALHRLAEGTRDEELRTIAKRLDRLAQMEFRWPAAEEPAS